LSILARDSGRQSKAWGGAQLQPRYDQNLSHKPAKRAAAIGNGEQQIATARFAGLTCIYAIFLGSRAAALHPRLYSAACSAGWECE